MKNYSMEARVRVIMRKTKGKGAQMKTCWKEVVVATNMQVGDIFMFRFHHNPIRGRLELIVEEVM